MMLSPNEGDCVVDSSPPCCRPSDPLSIESGIIDEGMAKEGCLVAESRPDSLSFEFDNWGFSGVPIL